MVVFLFLLSGMSIVHAEKPKYHLEISGNHAIAKRDLMQVLATERLILDRSFSETAIDDAAYMLELHYRERGFRGATVAYEFVPSPPSAHFIIEEGEPTLISHFEFTGNVHFTDEQLKSVYVSKLTNKQPAKTAPPYYPAAINDATNTLMDRYVYDGFTLVDIHTQTIPAEDGHLHLQVTVKEGPLYQFGKVIILNPAPLTEQEILEQVQPTLDKTYNPGHPLTIKNQIEEFYARKGYPLAEVTVSDDFSPLTAESHQVDLTIHIDARAEIHIGTITIQGNERTRTGSIRKRFGVSEGESYNIRRINRGLQRLFTSGAFADIELQKEYLSDNRINLTLDITETRARSISLYAGIGSYEGAMGRIRYRDNNVFGSLRRFQTEVYGSQKSYGGEISLSDPRLFNERIYGEAKIFFNYREQPAFSLNEVGTLWSLERKWTSRNSTTVQYLFKRVLNSTTDLDDDTGFFNRYTLGSIAFIQRYDQRNDLLHPTSGYFLEGRVEGASDITLSDIEMLRLSMRASLYIPLREATEESPDIPFLILASQAGSIFTNDPTHAFPLQEKFFIGGANSVRSFQEDELGPKSKNGIPLGGLSYSASTIELQVPIKPSLYLAFFGDMGSISQKESTLPTDNFRYAVGAGIRYYTPIGALRIDYGLNPDPQENESSGALHFSLGVAF